jgi:hypothetical protein
MPLNNKTSLLFFAKKIIFPLLLLSTIFIYRLNLCYKYGSEFPIEEQWHAEFSSLYIKSSNGELSLADLFTQNNEHLIPIQKIIHLMLFRGLGEWNILAQLYLNAALYSIFFGAILIYANFLKSEIAKIFLQLLIFLSALVPSPVENYLWGFQTGWYIYYIFSAICLFSLSKSKGCDLPLASGLMFAVLSCLCLASGIVNLLLCMIVIIWHIIFNRSSKNLVISLQIIAIFLAASFFFLFLSIAIGGRDGNSISLLKRFYNLWWILSYPNGLLPITFLPCGFFIYMLIFQRERRLTFLFLSTCWVGAHCLSIALARGGVYSRYSELLLLGVLANAGLLFAILYSQQGISNLSRWHLEKIGIFWLAVAFFGIGMQISMTADFPKQFKEDIVLPRNEVLKRVLKTGNTTDLTSRADQWTQGSPSRALSRTPELIFGSEASNAMPYFYTRKLKLDPSRYEKLRDEWDDNFPGPLPYSLWLKTPHLSQKPWSVEALVENIPTPWLKIIWMGRRENSKTGIYRPNGDHPLPEKSSFSQTSLWKTAFLPVSESNVAFTAQAVGTHDWMLIQEPMPCSNAQYIMEFIGRQAIKLLPVFIGLVFFIFSCRILLFICNTSENKFAHR